jgi:hypothetical protein
MPTRQSYDDAYGDDDAATVLSSKNKVAAAGLWGKDVAAAMRKHYQDVMPPINKRRAERERV